MSKPAGGRYSANTFEQLEHSNTQSSLELKVSQVKRFFPTSEEDALLDMELAASLVFAVDVPNVSDSRNNVERYQADNVSPLRLRE